MSTSSTNPGTLFGGSWETWGSGRVPIGVNSSDSDFSTAGKTGGAKAVNLNHSLTVNSHSHTTANHTLTVAEMPRHQHPIANSASGSYVASGASWFASTGWGPDLNPPRVNTDNIGGGGAHNHGNTGNSSPGTNSALSTTQSVVQPYITCYMWKRTA